MATNLESLLNTDHHQPQVSDDFVDKILDPPFIIKDQIRVGQSTIPRLTGEFWTSAQRQASSLQEISYRACFKPQLPRYFIERFTMSGEIVYDPFSGRGTTAIEAGLLGRRVVANDVNPLSRILTEPRLVPPSTSMIEERLACINYRGKLGADLDLSMFYHRDTEREIVALKKYLMERTVSGDEDSVDRWIRMVATNRLTGHSPGFFSVYTFPPNQAVSAQSQQKINDRRKQKPGYRDTKSLILKKTKSLLGDVTDRERANLGKSAKSARFFTGDARFTQAIANEAIQLSVTSPPFLDIVGYAGDNWLRCWFNEIDVQAVIENITMAKTIVQWSLVMGEVLKELYRVTKRGGWVAFEVGEIRRGKLKLEEHVVPLGLEAGFSCEAVLINRQIFTKTSNLWGVKNNESGTNSNRIVLFRR